MVQKMFEPLRFGCCFGIKPHQYKVPEWIQLSQRTNNIYLTVYIEVLGDVLRQPQGTNTICVENKYILREMTLETNEHTRKLKSSEM